MQGALISLKRVTCGLVGHQDWLFGTCGVEIVAVWFRKIRLIQLELVFAKENCHDALHLKLGKPHAQTGMFSCSDKR